MKNVNKRKRRGKGMGGERRGEDGEERGGDAEKRDKHREGDLKTTVEIRLCGHKLRTAQIGQ